MAQKDYKGRTGRERYQAGVKSLETAYVQLGGVAQAQKLLGKAVMALLDGIELVTGILLSIGLSETEGIPYDEQTADQQAECDSLALGMVDVEKRAKPVLKSQLEYGTPFALARFNATALLDKILAGVDDEETRAVRAAVDQDASAFNAFSKTLVGGYRFVSGMSKLRKETGNMIRNTKGELVPERVRVFSSEHVAESFKTHRRMAAEAIHSSGVYDPFLLAAFIRTLTGEPVAVKVNRRSGEYSVYIDKAGKATADVSKLTPLQKVARWCEAHSATILPSVNAGTAFIRGLVNETEVQAAVAECTAIGYTAVVKGEMVEFGAFQVPTGEPRLIKTAPIE